MKANFDIVLLQNMEDRELTFRQFSLYNCAFVRFDRFQILVFPRQQASDLTRSQDNCSVFTSKRWSLQLVITLIYDCLNVVAIIIKLYIILTGQDRHQTIQS